MSSADQEDIALDRVAEPPVEDDKRRSGEDKGASDASEAHPREWRGQHPINLRVTLPLPFRRWYVTLVAGPERRRRERLRDERSKHPLDTLPNVMFLLSIGIVSTTVLLIIAALVLIHGFGWSIDLTIPA